MTMPFDFGNNTLTTADFYRHELTFSRTISELFTCQNVRFIHLSTAGELTLQPQTYGGENDRPENFPETLRAGATLAVQQKQPVIDSRGSRAFMPLSHHDQTTSIVMLFGGSPTLYTNTTEWFTRQSRQAERELRLIKQWAVDPASGLLNANHLHLELQAAAFIAAETPPENPPSLLLIEVYPRARDAGQALSNIRKTGFYLDSLCGDSAPLHHLGSGIFALIWPGATEQEIQKLGYAILRKLKRGNAAKAHIGLAPITSRQSPTDDAKPAAPLAEAWQALRTARRRGVFALCSTTTLDPANQQLPPLAPALLAGFKKKWRAENQFAVILLRRDLNTSAADDRGHGADFPARLLSLLGEDTTIIPVAREQSGQELFIYLPGADQKEAAERAAVLKTKIEKLACGTYSQGIAVYPCPGFKKTDIPLNARKAIIHASFYGQAAITTFDAVSLNISGDIYYNEGDLNSAIREYRLGLNIEPDNINLLNSLGVIYAQIERYKMAIPLFERILAIADHDKRPAESDNFMAMYNLGFAHLRSGERQQAVRYFEQAVADARHYNNIADNSIFDLLLQLGQIYCTDGHYQNAVKVLNEAEAIVLSPHTAPRNQPWEHCEPWHESDNGFGHEQIYRYLGEAYKGINKNQEAITYLQRATRHNKRDAKALSLLGELYSIEKQGADIAVSLCRQAVELDGEAAGNWRRLAFTLLQDNDSEAALPAIKKSLGLAPKTPESLLLQAQIYKQLGMLAPARTTLERILKLDGTNKKAGKLLKQINRSK